MKEKYYKLNICKVSCKNCDTQDCKNDIKRRNDIGKVKVLFCESYEPNFEIKKVKKGKMKDETTIN